MVVTDLPFDMSAKMDDRYSMLLKPGQKLEQTPEEDPRGVPEIKNSQEYAKFLRDRERRCGPDGFVDSTRYRYPFAVKKGDLTECAPSGSKTTRTVVDLLAKKENNQKEYEKRLKTIEDHMWQHKQEERELKRVEGDIIKNQRTVRRTLRDYENAITRKRLTEEKKLNQGLEKYTRLQNVHTHKKEEITRARLENNVSTDQSHKDQGRKVQLTTSELARHYRTKLSEMDLKRVEAGRLHEEFETKFRKKEVGFCTMRSNTAHQYRAKVEQLEIVRSQAANLNRDYESRLRKKEEEQFRLKQELAELAIALNMESQKGRQQEEFHRRDRKREQHVRLSDDRKTNQGLENKLARSDGDNKAAEATKRKLSADLMLTKAHLQLKNREEIRHKQDVVSRLKNNGTEQKQLNDVALHAELDLKSKLIDQRVQDHNKRRQGIALSTLQAKKENTEKHEFHFSQRAAKRKAEQQRREHEDHLKHFSKEVTKGEETEYALYNKVKNAEYARQKQEQSVRRLSGKLLDVKRSNAIKIKEEMTERTKEEEEMHQRLQREQAQLYKMHTQREERYLVLQRHREKLRMDKYLLSEHEREHERLVRIGTRSEPASVTA